ncbi:two-component system regulatory protein YycI [Sporanaerobacter acetigenes]|uniref:two-component system regulatory protein YycI n=1 Tax=Sporanaerobacter acetigenes TaxID=165813 RepID=UPI001048B3A0|nr:two-component system regulatory protein YycI [Sporanaerobacter acetigenes]
MDWSKAKTILIIAFIVTNLLLAHVLFDNENIDEPTIKEGFIENAADLLQAKNIKVNCKIPNTQPSLSMMNVEYEKEGIDEINNNFFGGKTIGIEQEEEKVEFQINKEKVTLLDGKTLIYENSDDREKYAVLDKEKAISIAEDFLKEKGFSMDDMKLSFIKNDNGIYYLEYTKIYEGLYVEKTYTKFEIGKCGIKRFERFWLNTKEIGENQIYISTAPKAILGLLTMEEAYGKTIEDISLCYYFDPSRHEDINDPKKTREGKAIPAWRIQFDDGSKILLDEY